MRQFREASRRFKTGQFKGQIVPNHLVFFEKVESGRVKYLIRCDGNAGSQNTCRLSFPYSNSLIVEMKYLRIYVPYSIAMADKVKIKLQEFEIKGREILKD